MDAPCLSVFLITKNEAADLPSCLASVRSLADDIVVVDSGSTDTTCEIAEQSGARVFRRKMDGFSSQKQFAADQCRGAWLLSIDADERVTPKLADSIRAVLESAEPKPGYSITRRMYFLGKRLRFGGVGTDRVIRLFQRGKGRYLPMKVHERIEIDGPVGHLQGYLDHFSYATLEEYFEKSSQYTTLQAEDQRAKGRRPRWTDAFRPGWELLNRIMLKGAWLDGRPGLLYAALSAYTAWMRSIKLRHLPCP